MKLSLSIVTTIIIALVVWLIMLWQPPESWSNDAVSYEKLLALTANNQTETMPSKKPASSSDTMVNASDVKQSNAFQQDTVDIVGLNRRISLVDISKLWREFTDKKHLERAISTDTFDVYAVFSQFNASYSVADVSIGYERAALNDSAVTTQTLPTGKRFTLLSQGHYSNVDIVAAWENIDYRRGLIAVIEKRHFSGDDETVSLQAIYQE